MGVASLDADLGEQNSYTPILLTLGESRYDRNLNCHPMTADPSFYGAFKHP